MFNEYAAQKHEELYDLLRQEGYHVENSTSWNDEVPSWEVYGEYFGYQIFVPDGHDFKAYQLLVEGDPEFENESVDKLLRYLDERFEELEN